jgi:hypothetical protein
LYPHAFCQPHATALGNELQMLVALRRRGLDRAARHRARTRRHDDSRARVACHHPVIHVVSVERAVAGEGRDRTGDLVEQRTDLRAIIDVWGSQFGGDDFAGVGVNAEVQFPPGPARPRAMLLDQPSPGPHNRRPVLSTSGCTGTLLDRGRTTCNVSARRLKVEWSGTARARPSRRTIDPIRPSVWRNARRNTARKVSAVVIATAE